MSIIRKKETNAMLGNKQGTETKMVVKHNN